MKRFLLVFGILMFSAPAYAGKYGFSFLNIGVGARNLGYGCGVASVKDVSAFFWNPAGFVYVPNVQVEGMYAAQFGGFSEALAHYHHIGVAIPLKGEAAIAFNWLRFVVDEIPIFLELPGKNLFDRLQNPELLPSGEPIGYLRDVESAYFFSFAKKNHLNLNAGWKYFSFPLEIPIGLNFKILHSRLGSEQANGLGVDFGGMVRIDLKKMFLSRNLGVMQFGLTIKNIVPTAIRWTTRHRDELSKTRAVGISYVQSLPKIKAEVLLGAERDFDRSSKTSFGIEAKIRQRLFFRIGQIHNRLVAGAGLFVGSFRIDYAFSSHDLGSCHRISVVFIVKKGLPGA